MKNNCGRNSGSVINNQFNDKKEQTFLEDANSKDRKMENKMGGLTYKPFNIQKQFNSNHSLN